jgi:lipoate-protein ligase A
MAIDEAILGAVVAGATPPTLRFYGWAPPCLSLGRSQPLADADLVACRAAGVHVVRRPSGGRAILHTDELTYSLALMADDPRAGEGVVDGYRRLSEGLLAGLERLGAAASQAVGQGSHGAAAGSAATPICFETPSNYEITARGRKLVGSAQWRARGGVLQHGTLPLCGDLVRIVDCLALDAAARAAQRACVRERAATLEEVLGRAVSFAEAAGALAYGFSDALHVVLVPGSLTGDERARAAGLRRDRYAAADWTARVA